MIKSSTKIYTVVVLLLILFPRFSYSQEKIKNIVVFFSYNSTLPSFQFILEGYRSEISKKNDTQVNLIVEYLDILRSEDEEYPRFIIDLYKKKFKEIKIDLFITAGPGINSLLMKYGKELLGSVPVINIDIETPGRITLQDLNVKNGIDIGVIFRVGNTFREAFALFPDYKNIFIISGISKLDSYFESLATSCKNDFGSNYTFNFITGMPMDSIIQFVRRIPRNSIIMVTTYQLDGNKVVFSTPEVIKMISENSAAPVFPVTEAYLQKGTGIGGYLFNFTNLGKEAGRISHEILNGKLVSNIVVNESSFYQHIYDWQELKKWHLINSKAIPKDSVFYFKDISFFSLYKWYLIGLLLFLVSQTFMIVYLFRLNRRQKIITERMLETENMHRELIRSDRLSKMSTLTASLSHELYQPLAAIRFTAQAGKRYIQTGRLDMDRASRMFENILEDDIRATGIISSVKNLMKMETPEMGSVNLNSLIHETVNIVRTDAEKHRIKINIIFYIDPVFVFGDKIQLQQVLMNFIRNSVIAMEKSNPENRILEIILKQDKESVIVSVRDSGPGIDIAIREKIFKPFVTTRKEGFGIGLTLCKSIIEKHNGKIWAENNTQGGTIFSFSLQAIKNE